jgi:hypothetical protein
MDWTKKQLRALFKGTSDRLFEACYRQLRQWMRDETIDDPDLEGAESWINQIASEKVNNPKSSFS